MKKILIKAAILLVVFLTSLLAVSRIMNKGNAEMTVEMAKAALPVVTMHYGGHSINELHGYTDPVEVSYMRDSITPLTEDRSVSLQIDCYGSRIAGLGFEVRSVDGERLIESTSLPEFEQKEDQIFASFELKDLIEKGKEYNLVLLVTLENGSEIRYYTRVVWSEELFAKEKLDYVLDFSDKTFDKKKAEELTRYLESNAEGDNTTFGRVNIHSSFHQVTWGDLQAERLTEPTVAIKELASQTGSFLLQYYVTFSQGGEESICRVEEFFRVRYTADRMYLLDYDRTMNQLFDVTRDVFASNKIYLGIMGDEVPMMESDDGNVVAFIVEDRIYSYNLVEHKLAYLFGFYDRDNQDARTMYDKHNGRLLGVDEAGNVTFMVYGYMNRGRHEGQTGISVYFYDSTVNTTEELVYVPYHKSPELLLAEVEQLAYINKTGTLYLMLDNEIYGISAMNRSYEVIAGNLKEGSYQVSDSNRMIVWQDQQLYQGKKLVLLNLNTGSQTEIEAGSGEFIAPIGFMGEDLIYGLARKADIRWDYTGSTVFPMYCVRIQNETEGILKEYRQENIYVTEGVIEENQIILKRVQKTESGEYETISDDHIMNAETAQPFSNTLETAATEVYEKVTQIALKKEASKEPVQLLTPKEVLFEGSRNAALTGEETGEDNRYYVYGKSGIEGIFTDAGNAVNLADERSGVVTNGAGEYVWMKGNRSLKNQIMAIQGEAVTEEKDSLAVCLDTMLAFEGISRNSEYMLSQGMTVFSILEESLDHVQVLDLSGCSLDAVLYYVNQDIPVLVMTEEGSAVLLIGFNEMNTVIMNPETGTVYKMGMNDSREWFEKNGNRFITYIRNEE